MIRFELKYFDPFIVLDEFSGEKLCFLLCYIAGESVCVCLFVCFPRTWNFVTLQLLLLLVFLIIPIEVSKLAFSFSFYFVLEKFSLLRYILTNCSFFVMLFCNRLWDGHIHVAGRAKLNVSIHRLLLILNFPNGKHLMRPI